MTARRVALVLGVAVVGLVLALGHVADRLDRFEAALRGGR